MRFVPSFRSTVLAELIVPDKLQMFCHHRGGVERPPLLQVSQLRIREVTQRPFQQDKEEHERVKIVVGIGNPSLCRAREPRKMRQQPANCFCDKRQFRMTITDRASERGHRLSRVHEDKQRVCHLASGRKIFLGIQRGVPGQSNAFPN